MTAKQARRLADVYEEYGAHIKQAMEALRKLGFRADLLDCEVGDLGLMGSIYRKWSRTIRRMLKAVPRGRANEPRLKISGLAKRRCAALPMLERDELRMN